MSNTAQSLAANRIAALLDENSFVEIGGCVTARSTDFNLTDEKRRVYRCIYCEDSARS